MIQPNDQQVSSTFDVVMSIVVEILGIPHRAAALTPSTALLDGMPEFDSMAVVEIMTRLEKRFDVTFDGEDFSPETFETLGSLGQLIDAKIS
jgi:acyl carrier protein